jgi:hypothetical protein
MNGLKAPACLSELTAESAACTVELKVTNTGSYAGDAVIMAYFKTGSATDIKSKRVRFSFSDWTVTLEECYWESHRFCG